MKGNENRGGNRSGYSRVVAVEKATRGLRAEREKWALCSNPECCVAGRRSRDGEANR